MTEEQVVIINLESWLELEHEKLNNKLYIAFIGMVGIVISVISLAISFADKFNSLKLLIGKYLIMMKMIW